MKRDPGAAGENIFTKP